MYLRIPTTPTVVISGYDAIHDVTVKRGMVFGGRPVTFRMVESFKKTGIIYSTEPDRTWSSLRKTSHKHLRQFGDGISRLESVITEVGDDMLKEFMDHAGKPHNTKDTMFDTTLNSICFLITGEKKTSESKIVKMMRRYEFLAIQGASPLGSIQNALLDAMPWLRHLNIQAWKNVKDIQKLTDDIWEELRLINEANPDSESLYKVLMNSCADQTRVDKDTISGDVTYTEIDAKITSLSLLVAGVITTSRTMHSALNFLAHRSDIQEKILNEMQTVCGYNLPTLPDRPRLPYCHAFILETLRFTTVAPIAIPHCAIEDVTLQGYTIPKGTTLIINFWGLHHEPEFWIDPQNFRPDRFLDAEGELLPAEHPNRKHLMSFGAGTRVCVGQSLAMARMFVWITKIVSIFTISPADDNDPSCIRVENQIFDGILNMPTHHVVFHARK